MNNKIKVWRILRSSFCKAQSLPETCLRSTDRSQICQPPCLFAVCADSLAVCLLACLFLPCLGQSRCPHSSSLPFHSLTDPWIWAWALPGRAGLTFSKTHMGCEVVSQHSALRFPPHRQRKPSVVSGGQQTSYWMFFITTENRYIQFRFIYIYKAQFYNTVVSTTFNTKH